MPRPARRTALAFAACAVGLCAFAVHAAQVSVAVASNFAAPMKAIAARFEADSGHKATLAFGSTGAFYAQLKNGAPFQVLLAADDETPGKLEMEGLGVAGTRFTYATGQLALWSATPGLVDARGAVLSKGAFETIAIANPKLAPYGRAAQETLTRLGQWDKVQPRLVQGENIAQTYQFVATGNAQLGFVALSQVMEGGRIAKGSAWIVPADMHAPIRQDAIVLARGKDNAAAAALMTYLRSEKARAIMRGYGYSP
jgi:molybdate transport system substrate-binding protein